MLLSVHVTCDVGIMGSSLLILISACVMSGDIADLIISLIIIATHIEIRIGFGFLIKYPIVSMGSGTLVALSATRRLGLCLLFR